MLARDASLFAMNFRFLAGGIFACVPSPGGERCRRLDRCCISMVMGVTKVRSVCGDYTGDQLEGRSFESIRRTCTPRTPEAGHAGLYSGGQINCTVPFLEKSPR